MAPLSTCLVVAVDSKLKEILPIVLVRIVCCYLCTKPFFKGLFVSNLILGHSGDTGNMHQSYCKVKR